MEFWQVLKARRSVRKFKKQEVPDEALRRLIQAAHIAPSAGNKKNWRFIIVKDKALSLKMKDAVTERVDGLAAKMNSPTAKKEFTSYANYFTFFAEAPVVIAVVMTPYDSTSGRILKRYEPDSAYVSTAGIQGVSAAIENLLLAAAEQGLGACWMTGPMIGRDGLERALDINAPDTLEALIPVGCPKEKPAEHKLPESIEDIAEVK